MESQLMTDIHLLREECSLLSDYGMTAMRVRRKQSVDIQASHSGIEYQNL